MKPALIAPPVVASYLPTVPPRLFVTKRALPDTAIWTGSLRPVIKLALINSPLVEYSLTIPICEGLFCRTYSCAWVFFGTPKSAAMAMRKRQKARNSGLQFDMRVVFMAFVLFLGDRSESDKLAFGCCLRLSSHR